MEHKVTNFIVPLPSASSLSGHGPLPSRATQAFISEGFGSLVVLPELVVAVSPLT